MKGSLTVEASYIFPFGFLIIGLVCCLGIYSYNRSVLKMTGYECMIQMVNAQEMDDAVLKEKLEKNAVECAEKRILSVNELNAEVRVSATKVILRYSGSQTLLDLPLDVTVVYEKTFPEFTLRLMK